MSHLIKEELKDVYGILGRFKRKDFSGNTGQAMKNSSYQIATTLTAKIGSLLFTIVIARMLMPELFGLYGLALSTILFLAIFSDLGIGTAIHTFLSKKIDNEKAKAKAYFYHLFRIKIFLIFLTSILILSLSYWISNNYYRKPIFYALLAGAIYFPLSNLSGFLGVLFTSRNNFKVDFFGEVIFQVLRLIVTPLIILSLLGSIKNIGVILLWLFLGLSLCFLVTGIYYLILFFRDNPFKGIFLEKLNKGEKKELSNFILPLSVTSLSGVFFGYIDVVMLGHYVTSEFIGFYQAAFNLISSAAVILGFSAGSTFPIFSRIKGKKLERGFKKAKTLTILISFLALIFTFLISKVVILLVYGGAYSQSVLYFQILSFLLISFPMINLYQTYYTSQKQTKIFSILLILSTILNILLNYLFINLGLRYGMNEATIGACIATIISRYSYLFGLSIFRKKRI